MHYDLLRLSLRSKDLSFGLSFKTFSYGVFTSPRIYNVDTCLCHKSKTSGAPLNSSSRQQFVVSTWRTWRLGELGDFGPAHSRGCPSVGTTTPCSSTWALFLSSILLHHGSISSRPRQKSPPRHHMLTLSSRDVATLTALDCYHVCVLATSCLGARCT